MRKLVHRSFIIVTFSAIVSMASTFGCANSSGRAPPASSLAIAITTPGTPPSAQQLTTINQLLQSQITSRGFVVATNVAFADYVMRVRFTPDTVNPPGGHLEFLGIERNHRPGTHGENSAVEAGANNLAELRKVISEIEWSNVTSK